MRKTPQMNRLSNTRTVTLTFMASSFLLFSLALASPKVQASEILTLKTHIEVQADTVTLADLFPNAKRYRSTPLFKSPPLGRQGTVGLEQLIAVAARYDFTFDTPLNLKNITVSRPARTIKQQVFEKLLRAKINKQDEGERDDKITILTYDTPLKDQMVPLHLSGKVKIQSFTFNKISKTFIAEFLPTDTFSQNHSRTLSGKVSFAYKRPILARPIKRGEKITQSDIQIKTFKHYQVPRNALKNNTKIVGLLATKNLKTGSFLKPSDLETPKMIQKNQLVTLIFKKSNLSLKTQGKAMADGSLNDTIAVMNINSKRTVHGIIKAPGIVMIQNTIDPKLQQTAHLTN